MSTSGQQHIPRGFSLVFNRGELGQSASSGHFRIEGTLYQQQGQAHLNAAGRYAFISSAQDDGFKADRKDYTSLSELMSTLKLTQDNVTHLDARLMGLLNRA